MHRVVTDGVTTNGVTTNEVVTVGATTVRAVIVDERIKTGNIKITCEETQKGQYGTFL